MNAALRIAALAMAAFLPPASMTTCLDTDHTTTIYPDGSGRMVLTLCFKLDEPPKDGGADEFLAEFILGAHGFTAWNSPILKGTRKGTGHFGTYSFTGYFEDIAKVWIDSDFPNPGADRGVPDLSFELTRTIASQTLTIRDVRVAGALRRAPDGDGDDVYSGSITVPGKITRSVGWTEVKGRTASFRFDEKLLRAANIGEEGARKIVEALADPATITWKEDDVPRAEVEAFKKEYAKALAGWKELEPKLQKIQERLAEEKEQRRWK
jgi:hypothetical protein